MRHVERNLLSVLLLACATQGRAAAQQPSLAPSSPSSTEGALFLLLPVGAKGVALGRAMTAMQGPESVWWNPAGLAAVQHSRFVMIRGDQVTGTETAASLLFAKPGLGVLGVSYLLLDEGSQDVTDSDGNFQGTLTLRNHLAILSASTRLLGHLDAGVNLKMVQYRFSCRGSCLAAGLDAGTVATTYAVDAGIQLEPTHVFPLRVGVMVAHMGPRLQVLNAAQADPLPTRARVAVAYDVLSSLTRRQDLQGWVTVEAQERVRNPGPMALYVGSELKAGLVDALYLRAGYVVNDVDAESGARVGLGLHYQRFDLSIAKSLAVSTLTGQTEPVHVTFAVTF
jgi:hypothetical protein